MFYKQKTVSIDNFLQQPKKTTEYRVPTAKMVKQHNLEAVTDQAWPPIHEEGFEITDLIRLAVLPKQNIPKIAVIWMRQYVVW
jgi:hypothetical protein